MNRQLVLGFLATTLFALACPADGVASILMFEDFEDNSVNFTASDGLFYDTANDHFTIAPLNGASAPSDGPYSGFAGNNYFSAEDIDDPQGPGTDSQTLTFLVNISGYSDLSFYGLFAAGNSLGNDAQYDAPDGVRVRAQIDGGPIQNLLFLEATQPGGDRFNNELRVDSDFDGIGDDLLIDTNAKAFNLGILGTGSTLALTIEVHADAAGEELAFDNIRVSGLMAPVPEPTSWLIWSGFGLLGLCLVRRRA